MKLIRLFICLYAILFLDSCTGIKNVLLNPSLEKSNCNQQNRYSYTSNDIPRPIHDIQFDTAVTARFSFKSLNVAHAIGILDMLSVYVNLYKLQKQNPATEDRLAVVEILQKINQRINIASLEISAIASEMDCEEERADQIATYLKAKEDETETKLTVGAIIIGASGAIATGLLINNGNTADYIGIGMGITEATLGLLILLNKGTVTFHHPRNALREIWEGRDTSEVFSAQVWYYLNYFNPDKPDHPSLRYQIIERWMNFGQIAEAKTKKKRKLMEMYFGDGGKYTAEQLTNRANMLDQLEAHINLMKQDLKGLATELEQLK